MKSNLSTVPAGQPDLRSARSQIERDFSDLQRQNPRLLRLALNEAEALAWEIELPHLVYPVLAEEKARALFNWRLRQRVIRTNGTSLSFAE